VVTADVKWVTPLEIKMNIPRLASSQKMLMAEITIPDFLSTLQKPSSTYRGAPSANSLFASGNIGGRIEGVVHPRNLLRTGAL
jgi:hypothetical protein